VSKKIPKASRPNRDPDHYSKRSVPYWWAPEWMRGTMGELIYEREVDSETTVFDDDLLLLSDGRMVEPCRSYGKIHAVKTKKGDVELHMLSKTGNLSYIQGSIQQEFKKWHEDRSIDYLLLGEDPDDIIKDLSVED